MKYVIAIVLISLLPSFANAQMTEAQARNCLFDPIVIGETTIEEARCTLERKDMKHLNTFKVRQTQFDTYHFRSSRFRMTSLVFKNGVLIQIYEAESA